MLFPAQHDLPVLVNDLPLFNTPLSRLAASLRTQDSAVRFLDIGANIGDGLPTVDLQPTDRSWLVEGSDEFLPYLRYNTRTFSNVTIFPTYVAEQATITRGHEVVVAGNAHVVEDLNGQIRFDTIDNLFAPPEKDCPNLLKIDVEGHESRVFAGAKRMLQEIQPVIFTEWHPRLLADQQLDTFAALEQLRRAGYNDAIVYDNHGFLLCECLLSDRAQLERLAGYARLRDFFYYDLAVFAPKHSPQQDRFRKTETNFFGSLSPLQVAQRHGT